MVALVNAVDANVLQTAPNNNYGLTKTLALTANGGGQERQSYIFFSLPFPKGVTITSAILRLYNTTSAAWAGSNTVSVWRANAAWSANRITFNNRPSIFAGSASLAKTSPAANEEWAIDVKTLIQAVSDGGAWYGFRITSTGLGAKYMHSAQSVQPYRPTLEIQWADNPQPPEVLRPDGNRAVGIGNPVLRFDFTDVSGSTQMAACQVQLNSTDAWTNPSFDTGPLLTSLPQVDLAGSLVSEREVTLNGTTTITAAAGTFHSSDVGATITGTNIPGGATISAFTSSSQVTISAAATGSGTITATISKTYAGLSNGASIFWRVRVQDGVGLWSDWSDAAQFQRQNHGTLTLNNPAASPNNFVYESTPPIDWTFTGRTQKHYQVIVSLNSNTSKWLWDSGKITSTATVVTLPAGVLKLDDQVYHLRVRVWDTISREGTPTDTTYVEVTRTFTFDDDAGVAGVTSLVATPQTPYPWMLLTWNRTTMPDFWEITRDAKPITKEEGVDFFVSGTSYQYMDRLADPRVQHTWRVYAIVNGKRDATGTSVVGTTRMDSAMLARVDGTEPVMLLNYTSSPELQSISEVHEVLGEVAPVLITQSLRGYEGSISGIIADNTLSGRTARQQRDSLKKFREEQGTKFLLYLVDEAFEVVAFNITYKAIAHSGGGVKYAVSFDFFQTDF